MKVKKAFVTPDTPVIFTPLHFCSYDIPLAKNVIGKHVYTMLATDTAHGLVNRAVLKAGGIIDVDRFDKNSRKLASETSDGILKRKNNLVIFPEATWNPSDELTLPFWAGAAALAKANDAYIVPFITEYTWKTCHVDICEPFKVTEYPDDITATNAIRDIANDSKRKLRDNYGLTSEDRKVLRLYHRDIYPYLDPNVEMKAVQGYKNEPEKIRKMYSEWLDQKENGEL